MPGGSETTQVATIGQSNNPLPKPLIILATPIYQDNHTIPWRYNVGEVILASQEKASPTKEVTNIAGIGGVTRSGRVHAPEAL
ncbi:hypothetical protein CR513_44672, partial [Mucuna pruriens]